MDIDMETPVDRRVRKTKNILRETLTKLLMTKDIKDITVKELTSLADVNRGTFYLHYTDIYDMYDQIQKEIFEEIKHIIDKHLKHHDTSSLSYLVSEIFDLLSKNRELALVILNSSNSNILTNIIESSKPKASEDWVALLGSIDPELYEHYYTFITTGCVGLIHNWLSSGMNEAPGVMAKIAGDLISLAKPGC